MMRSAIGFGIGMALAFGAFGIGSGTVRAQDEKAEEAKPQDEKPLAKKILGTYTYESGKRGDDDVPNDRLTGSVEITKDEIKLLSADGDAEFTIEYTLKPGEDDKPAMLDMEITESVLDEAEGSKAKGLVKLEDDTLTLIYDYSGGEPKGFEPSDAMQHLFVMKRKADDK